MRFGQFEQIMKLLLRIKFNLFFVRDFYYFFKFGTSAKIRFPTKEICSSADGTRDFNRRIVCVRCGTRTNSRALNSGLSFYKKRCTAESENVLVTTETTAKGRKDNSEKSGFLPHLTTFFGS